METLLWLFQSLFTSETNRSSRQNRVLSMRPDRVTKNSVTETILTFETIVWKPGSMLNEGSYCVMSHSIQRKTLTTYDLRSAQMNTVALDSSSQEPNSQAPSPPPLPMAWYHKASWALYNLAANNAVAVTAAYWSLLYGGWKLDGLDITTHVLNTVFMVVETLASSVPVHLLHVTHSMLFMSLYILFSVIYWLKGGTNAFGLPYIYFTMDYGGNPRLAVGMVLGWVLIGQPLVQLILFFVYKMRVMVFKRCWSSGEAWTCRRLVQL